MEDELIKLGYVTPSNVYKLLQKSKKGLEFSDEGTNYIYQLIAEKAVNKQQFSTKEELKEFVECEFNRSFAHKLRKKMEEKHFKRFVQQIDANIQYVNALLLNNGLCGLVSAFSESSVYIFRTVSIQKLAKMKIEVRSQEALKEADYKLYVQMQAYMVLTEKKECELMLYNQFIDCVHTILLDRDPFLAKQIKERINKAMHYVKKKKIK